MLSIFFAISAILGMISGLPVDESRIVGGSRIPTGLIPFMAGYEVPNTDNEASLCGGTLITPRHVLTAAHCFNSKSRPIGMDVFINSLKLSRTGLARQAVVRKVTAVKVHELYKIITIPGEPTPSELPNGYDIAILTLDQTVSTAVKPVQLANCSQAPANQGNIPALVAGWGITNPEDDSSTSDVLLGTSLTITTNAYCQTFVPKTGPNIGSTQICANHIPGGRDTCGGDSGGPLLIGNQRTGFVQVGVLSYGPADCGAKGSPPGVYTRVSRFFDWINTNTGGLLDK